ncbi:MAG: hypothetical protein MRY64_07330 [Hyphomonadaceae bacterium]|nr:hypothetical protein [Hyphomonadaceae bacterium]
MKTITTLALGALAFAAGTAKAMHHSQTADPFAAYWCSPANTVASDAGLLAFNGHCWGCGLALLGALILAGGAARLITARRLAATQRPARLRALEA